MLGGDEDSCSMDTDGVLIGGGPDLEALQARTEEAGIGESNNIQVLHFDGCYGSHDIRLIELSKDLVELFKKEKEFILRGEEGEDAVLCTSNQTYELRECTTSNSLLLSPGLDRTTEEREPVIRHISATTFTYYEEIRSGLDDIGSVELDGYWRTVESEYLTSVMSRVLMLLVEKEWSWEKVPLIECCRTLEELQPLFVSELSLRLYGTQVEESDSEVYIKLSEDKVCKFYAEYILSSSAGMFHLSEVSTLLDLTYGEWYSRTL
eukprot:sb/3468348/